jgi:hypothetical protein
VKVGDLVYSGHMMEIGHLVLGIVTEIHSVRAKPDDPMFFIFWVDGSEPSWYYSNEVERVNEAR